MKGETSLCRSNKNFKTIWESHFFNNLSLSKHVRLEQFTANSFLSAGRAFFDSSRIFVLTKSIFVQLRQMFMVHTKRVGCSIVQWYPSLPCFVTLYRFCISWFFNAMVKSLLELSCKNIAEFIQNG